MKKILNNIFKIIIFLAKSIFYFIYCFFTLAPFAVGAYDLLFARMVVNNYSENFIYYVLGFMTLALVMFIALFIKLKPIKKFLFLTFLLITCLCTLKYTESPYEAQLLSDFNLCIEDDICKKGIEIKRKGKNIIINEQSCKELNGKWKEDTCYL